jgi:serine/threonine protein kinase
LFDRIAVVYFCTGIAEQLAPLEIARENVSLLGELGRGQFGTVLEASAVNLPGGTGKPQAVAVKFLQESMSTNDKHAFMQEAVSASRLHHSNVVQLLAVCFESQPCFLVFEFMPNGDLKAFLQACAPSKLSSSNLAATSTLSAVHLLKLAQDVSAGFSYLASLKVVHRDVAARNVLLGRDFTAKLGDFGLARQLYQSEVSVVLCGHVGSLL